MSDASIAIKKQHQLEIRARLSLITYYQKRLHELEEQARIPQHTQLMLERAFAYALMHGIGSDAPADLAERASLTRDLRAEYETVQRTIHSIMVIIEALQEALTFYLAEEYDFDPMKDAYELDVDGGFLYKIFQEKGGQPV
jgi:hypothetical protein